MPMKQQTFDSAGPDIRVRGNAYQVWEKYLGLARDAQSAGDRIAAENFFQHAEHYYRIMNANGADPATYNGRPRYQPRSEDGSFEEEQPGGQAQPPQQQQGQPERQERQERPRDGRPRHQGENGQSGGPGGNGSDEPSDDTAGS
jgi:hypothetical protein